MDRRYRDPEDFTIGWICALPIELSAAQLLLDEEYECEANEQNSYTFGRMGDHNVVIVHLPAGRMGTNDAATAAARMHSTFTSLRFSLMVGIAGGAPSKESDVRLGDVVISQPHGTHNGVVQYDFGKVLAGGHASRTGNLRGPPDDLLNTLTKMRAALFRDLNRFDMSLSRFEGIARFNRPSIDILFQPGYNHFEGAATCEHCDHKRIVQRPARESKEIVIHYGTIASGNRVIKDGVTRDELNEKLGGVLCFEMEAAGLMNHVSCLVIRGICDYADSHKNKDWQPYAAATAAACAKELLSHVPVIKSSVNSKDQQKKIRKRILSSLWFPEMNSRENSIEEASKDTVNWIFKTGDKDSSNENSDGGASNDNSEIKHVYSLQHRPDSLAHEFQRWLGSEESVFWISGKPGSGKSTLMKYLIQEPRTLKCLAKWRRPVKIYKFFFIEQGISPLQRQLKGCFRALLHQILISEDVKMAKFHQISFTLHEKVSEYDWSVRELEDVLLKALEGHAATCIFLDGLDEIDAQSDERLQAITFIKSLNRLPNVKVCVSSRPEPFFQHTMGSYPSLKVQDLNYEAIKAYTKERLGPYWSLFGTNQRTYRLFIHQIIDSSRGVFLWIALVLRSVIRGLMNGDAAETLQERVKELPPDLYGLYQQIWIRHNADLSLYKRETAEIFWFALNMPEDAMSRMWLEGPYPEPNTPPLQHRPIFFAIATNKDLCDRVCHRLANDTFSEEDEQLVIEQCAKWLSARTAGLLEYQKGRVGFIHRSAIEFLKNTNEGRDILMFDKRSNGTRWLNLINAYMLEEHACRYRHEYQSIQLPDFETRKIKINLWSNFVNLVVAVAIAGYIDEEEEATCLMKYQSLRQSQNGRLDRAYFETAVFLRSDAFIKNHSDTIAQFSPQSRSMLLINILIQGRRFYNTPILDPYWWGRPPQYIFEYVALQENKINCDLGKAHYYEERGLKRLLSITRLLLINKIDPNFKIEGEDFKLKEYQVTPSTAFLVAAFVSVTNVLVSLSIREDSHQNEYPYKIPFLLHVHQGILEIQQCIKLLKEQGDIQDQEAILYLYEVSGCFWFSQEPWRVSARFAVKVNWFIQYFKILENRVQELKISTSEVAEQELELIGQHCRTFEDQHEHPFPIRCLSLEGTDGVWWDVSSKAHPGTLPLELAFEKLLRLTHTQSKLRRDPNLSKTLAEARSSLIGEWKQWQAHVHSTFKDDPELENEIGPDIIQKFEPEQPEMAGRISDLCLQLKRNGQHEQSKVLYNRALRAYEEVLGSDHARTYVLLTDELRKEFGDEPLKDNAEELPKKVAEDIESISVAQICSTKQSRRRRLLKWFKGNERAEARTNN